MTTKLLLEEGSCSQPAKYTVKVQQGRKLVALMTLKKNVLLLNVFLYQLSPRLL